jgi:hypothetical protein
MKKLSHLFNIVALVLVLSGTVLAALVLMHRMSWTYALVAFGMAAILATVQLGWQFYLFWRALRKNDKTVRNNR